MQLSKNFKLDEFYVSMSFPDLAEKIERTEDDKQKMLVLANTLLQPVRDLYGSVRIKSGKRSPELNTAIKGAAQSEHLYTGHSAAVDFTFIKEGAVEKAYRWLVENRPNCFGQLIWYKKSNFVHVSLPTLRNLGKSWEWEK